MTVDMDIEERLNDLLAQLNAAGIGGVEANGIQGQQQGSSKKADGSDSTPSTQSSSSDAQILEIFKKLRQARPDSPEILAALKSPDFRAFAMLLAQHYEGGAAPAAAAAAPAKKAAAPSLDEVMEDDDDAYPKIGPGYSDEYSVVSELSTPTVMTRQQVAEEEHYNDVNRGPGTLPPLNIALGPGQALPSRPPMQIGAASGGGRLKSKNLVGQVQSSAARRAIARSGGAAAQRRLNYQQAMAKLQSTDGAVAASIAAKKKDPRLMNGYSPKKGNSYFQSAPPTPAQDPSQFPSLADNRKGRGVRKVSTDSKKKGKKAALASQEVQESFEELDDGSVEHKKSRKKSSKKDSSKSSGSSSGWPAFDEAASSSRKKSSSKDVFSVDDEGFFPSDAFGSNAFSSSKSTGSDPFAPAAGSDPFSENSGKSRRSKEDPFADTPNSSRPRTRSSKNRDDKDAWTSEKASSTKKERSRKKSSRRASLAM